MHNAQRRRSLLIERRNLVVEGRRRDYILVIPADLPSSCPLVFAFHGAGSNADAMRDFCQLEKKALQSRFALVFPEGTGRTERMRSWNAGAPHVFAAKARVNDVLFFQRLLTEIAPVVHADPQRIFLTGMSNGGLLCYHLANELGGLISAIAPVACSMVKLQITCGKPMRVIHIHGTKDDYVPYQGGAGGRSAARSKFVSVEQLVEAWAVHGRCGPTPVRTLLAPSVIDGTTVERLVYRDDSANDCVVLYTVHEGGHTWPGVPSSYEFLGKVTQNLQANNVIWDFFATSVGS